MKKNNLFKICRSEMLPKCSLGIDKSQAFTGDFSICQERFGSIFDLLKIIMMCVSILFFLSSPASSGGLRELKHSDFNGDSSLNLADAIMLLKVFTGSSATLALASAEESLPVKMGDVIHILYRLAASPYEADDDISQSSLILVNDPNPQTHYFNDSDDEDLGDVLRRAGDILCD